jgi:hypothetical protein
MTVEELHQFLFALAGDTAVEVEAGIDITAATFGSGSTFARCRTLPRAGDIHVLAHLGFGA